MARSKRTSNERESPRSSYWRERIEEWEVSGLTQVEFCRLEKLSLPSLRWWKWELARRDGLRNQPMFLPVRLTDTEEQETPSRQPSSVLEIVVETGYRIRVPQHFNPETLLRLLKTLEASRC
jgi:hypothetical protein